MWPIVLALACGATALGRSHEDADLLRVLALQPGMMVADIGCGNGRITTLVAGEVGPDGVVFGVEIDEKRVNELRERRIANVIALLSMPNDVSLEQDSLDLAFMHDVAAHVKKEARPEFYGSVARALRPDGLLVIFGHHDDTHKIFEEVGRYGFRPENAGAYTELTARELDARMEEGVRFRYQPSSGELEIDLIEGIVEAKGRFDAAAQSLNVALPRKGVTVVAEGRVLDPAAFIVSRATFQATRNTEVALTCEFALFDDELNLALDTALAHGLTVTALHDHLLHESPPTRFMHARGAGETTRMARAFRSVLDEVTDSRAAPDLGPAGMAGKRAAGVPTRAVLEEVLGFEVPAGAAGLAFELETGFPGMLNRAAFSGSDQAAHVKGRFACAESELRGVLLALRKGALDVWAVNPPQSELDPVTFVHYRGPGPARDLASAVRDALEAQRAEQQQ